MVSEISGLKASDRYFTPSPVLDKVAQQWVSINVDPCWDPECAVVADLVYDARAGQDGLVLPWRGRIFCNPPWSDPAPWALRAVQHTAASPDHEVILLVAAQPGSQWWGRYVWEYGLVCFPDKRLRYGKPGGATPTPCPTDSAVVYYGPHKQRFLEVWSDLGKVVTLKAA